MVQFMEVLQELPLTCWSVSDVPGEGRGRGRGAWVGGPTRVGGLLDEVFCDGDVRDILAQLTPNSLRERG